MRAIRLDLLADEARTRVLKEYRKALAAAEHLTYEEAAWYYGYTYQTLRHYVMMGRLKPLRRRTKVKWLTHAEMRRYARSKQVSGSPKKSQRTQLAIA